MRRIPLSRRSHIRRVAHVPEAHAYAEPAAGRTQQALAETVLSAAEGILGEIVSIVTRAAVRAITSGTESITAKLIDEMGFISPSQRPRAAVCVRVSVR